MRLPESALEFLTPQGEPSRELTPGDTLARAERIEGALLRRSYLWATAINTLLLHTDDLALHKVLHLSAGFVYLGGQISPNIFLRLPKQERVARALRENQFRHDGGFAFGGYVLAEANEKDTPSGQLNFIEVGDEVFPVVTIFGSIAPHGCPPHPHTGTGTCWVETTSPTATWSKGILTCRHTVKHLPIGATVTFHPSTAHALPTSGTLAEYNECTLDAAFVEVGSSDWPSGLATFAARRPLAPGSRVNFTGRFTGPNSGSVLRVFQYGTYIGNLFGQRVIADCFGTNGDSGTLLETASGDGAGIYMGTIPDGSGGNDGIYQDLAQVKDFFGLTLYK